MTGDGVPPGGGASIRGLELSRGFFRDAVEPLLHAGFATLRYSAALIGPGSEVIGYDDDVSTDHHWGPRVLLFCSDADAAELGLRIRAYLAGRLPREYRGYPTNFTEPDPSDHGTQLLEPVAAGPINHRVEVVGIRAWFGDYLGIELGDAPPRLDPVDWLTLPQQKLLSIVSGEVFTEGVDGLTLADIRSELAWYPDDVWRFILASVWARIAEEEHLVGRAGSVGDELGARVIASRLVRDAMRLAFLAERRYAPYPKWFGTAFSRLGSAKRLGPLLAAVTDATNWRDRDAAFAPAYEELARLHNGLRLTARLPEAVKQFYGRPFRVMAIQGFSTALLDTIRSPWLTETVRRSPIGGIDLVTDNTDLLEDPAYRARVRGLYR